MFHLHFRISTNNINLKKYLNLTRLKKKIENLNVGLNRQPMWRGFSKTEYISEKHPIKAMFLHLRQHHFKFIHAARAPLLKEEGHVNF